MIMDSDYPLLDDMSSKFGDSFYLLQSDRFSKNYDDFLDLFKSIYPKTNIGYSYKTNYTPKLCKIILLKGGYAEVVSDMEYDLAVKLGVKTSMIIVNGPYKSNDLLERYLLGNSIVNIDSYSDYESLKAISIKFPNKKFEIGVRCNFDIDNQTISRFGFDVTSDNFNKLIENINSLPNVTLSGIHCHYPDRDLKSFKVRVDKILSLAERLFSTPPKYIDIGGGFFGKMPLSLSSQFDCQFVTYSEYAKTIATKFRDFFQKYSLDDSPILILEPGSAIVADTIHFVSRVIDIKEIRGKFFATVSGSKFNIGLLTSNINMPMQVIRSNDSKKQNNRYHAIDIVGYTCIEGDCLSRDYEGNIGVKDFVIFSNVGSYSLVFKPQFILPNVPMIEYIDAPGKYEIVKRQEKSEDVFSTYIF